MIKIRINALDSKEFTLPLVEGETLQDTWERFVNHQKKFPKDSEALECFNIYIGGELIPRDFWPRVKPKHDAEVLIALTPQSRNFGQVITVAALAVAAAYSAPLLTAGAAAATAGSYGVAAGYYLGAAGIGMAAAIGSQLLVNALIPPPDTGINGVQTPQESSQMYTISGQSNQVKKYGYVPKVYGRHRMFPFVAAAPYTSLETDRGEIVQYFHAIYDLGYGPAIVEDIRIGDTSITNFNDVTIRLVDFNRPSVSEGVWDDALVNNLALYKGDNSTTSIGVNLNQNQQDSGSQAANYQVIRSADFDNSGDAQEFVLTFVCPQGLTTVATNADRLPRNIELNVEFREVGTTAWTNWNDPSATKSFSSVGDTQGLEPKKIQLTLDGGTGFDANFGMFKLWFKPVHRLISDNEARATFSSTFYNANTGKNFFITEYYLGRNFQKKFNSKTFISVDSYITGGGEIIGKIKSRVDTGNPAVGYLYELYSQPTRDVFVGVDYIASTGDVRTQNVAFTSQFDDQIIFLQNALRIQVGATGNFIIKGESQSPVYTQLRFAPTLSKEYEIRVTRVRSYGGHGFQVFDALQWSSLVTRYDRAPIITDKRHVFLELKIKATDQLNGSIRDLNAVLTSVLDVYDENTDTWSKQATRNPAWVFADLLTGEVNKNAIDKSRLDTTSILEYAAFCDEIPTPPPSQVFDEKRFNCDFVLDFSSTLSGLISQVTAMSQSSMNIINGKYGVLIDKQKTTPVQLFTPRNYSGFSSNRIYAHLPHALKVKYVDSYSDWNRKEVLVYSDGYDANNATEFQDLDTFGATNNEQAWRFGRYNLAQAKLRQEQISIDVDFEHLVCTRGDLVRFQQDAMIVGGTPARVKTVDTGINEITIDDKFVTVPLVNYGYTFRSSLGEIQTGTLTITDSDTATYTGPAPAVGDLIVWGEIDKITIECIVKSIIPNQDETATITLVEYVPEIYDAESTDVLPDYDPQFATIPDSELAAPNLVENLAVSENDYRCTGFNYEYYVTLTWTAPTGQAVDKYEIYRDNGTGFDLVGITPGLTFEYILENTDYLGVEHSFKVLAVAANGAKKGLGEAVSIEATPLTKTSPPGNVERLYINITNETLSLDWDLVTDCDINEYQIRYSPTLTGTWATSIPLQTVDRNTSLATFQARTGTYLIKAVDFNGNFSTTAAKAITSIPELVNLNVIETINDFPTLPGSKDRVELFGDTIVLKATTGGGPGVTEYEPEGYYYFTDFLDLGEIFSVRLNSSIEAEGFTPDDMMYTWTTLSGVAALSNAQTSEWNVETQYRATEVFNSLSAWPDMSSINPISEGAQDIWTPWVKFTNGDFTGRIFQFRLRLISNLVSVSPRVINGTIKADMPDRVLSFDNVLGEIGGKTLTYNPAFYGPGTTPNVQVSIDNASTGDYWQFTSKTLNSCTIKFYDNNDTEVVRQFDVQVKGYGRKYNEIL